jgi:hypothetical protein
VLKIHTADGKTTAVDLADETQARDFFARLGRAEFQRAISGVTLVEEHSARAACPYCGARCAALLGIQYSVSRPQDFRHVETSAELIDAEGRVKGGERLIVYADDVKMTIMAHANQPSVRVVLAKVGRRKFNPDGRRNVGG